MSIPWQNEVSKMALVTVTSKLKKKQNKPPTNVFWTHYLLDARDHGLFPLTYKFFFSSSSAKYFSNMEENSETKYIKCPIAPWLGMGTWGSPPSSKLEFWPTWYCAGHLREEESLLFREVTASNVPVDGPTRI